MCIVIQKAKSLNYVVISIFLKQNKFIHTIFLAYEISQLKSSYKSQGVGVMYSGEYDVCDVIVCASVGIHSE